MLKEILSFGNTLDPKQDSAVLKMASHDRMGGSVPVWEKASTAKQQTEQRFADALNESTSANTSSFQLSLNAENNPAESGAEKPFGFGDLIDMINPLHHIPILGSLYRNISGDDIRGPGQVIGGALYGGPIGAATSMINMLVKHDTGRDITDHALNLTRSETPKSYAQNSKYYHSETQNTVDIDRAILAYQTAPISNQSQPSIQTTRL